MSDVQFTNTNGIALSMAVWLATDNYDYSDDPNTISATTLLKPIREIILSRQNKNLIKVGDISSLIASSMGSALHDSIEMAWINKDNLYKALRALGYPSSVVDRVIVNPTEEALRNKPDAIPVYLEKRTVKQIGQYKISGKLDFVMEGRVEDFKSTSVFSYMDQTNIQKYIQQGSIYRWLNPTIITNNHMAIQYIFTDWSKRESFKNPKYPKSKLLEQTLPLMSIQETEYFIRSILEQITKFENVPQAELPLCTDKELWVKPSIWKYYKNPNKTTRATANGKTYAEVHDRFMKDGCVGIIKEIKGTPTKCRYCPVADICTQAQGYVGEGILTLNN